MSKMIAGQELLDAMFGPSKSKLADIMGDVSAHLVEPERQEFSDEQWADVFAKMINLRQCIDYALREHFKTDPADVPQDINAINGEMAPWRVASLHN